jgi:hypothetical protein
MKGQKQAITYWVHLSVLLTSASVGAAARTRATAPAYQVGCPEVVPILKATPVWTDVLRDTEWVKRLEEAAPAIREELLALKGKHGFQVSLRHSSFKHTSSEAYGLRSLARRRSPSTDWQSRR